MTGGAEYDTALVVAVALAVFAILFGTRKIDVTEHHEGMMMAIAFESIVKLLAFVAVGAFAVLLLSDGGGELPRPRRARTPCSDSTMYQIPL